jgi:hypothetical protein
VPNGDPATGVRLPSALMENAVVVLLNWLATKTNRAEGTTTISFHATDNVGNVESPDHTVTVKLDKTNPAVTCASPDGLWHATDVSIACTAGDTLSGLAVAGDASFSLSTSVAANTETNNASTNSRAVCDVAGNCATAGPFSGNMVDKKPPSITITAPGGIDPRTGQPDEKLPDTFDRKIISVDCAFNDLATSDYVALAVIGVAKAKPARSRWVLSYPLYSRRLALYGLGLTYEAEGRFDKAIFYFQKRDPSHDLELGIDLAVAYAAAGRKADARPQIDHRDAAPYARKTLYTAGLRGGGVREPR